MRILRSLGIPSYLSQYEEISVKDSGIRFLSLMHLPETSPNIIPFSQYQPPQQHQLAPTTRPSQPPRASASTEYYSDSEIREDMIVAGPGENYRDIALQNQRLLSLNQQFLHKKLSHLERSFSTHMTKVEKTLDKVVSTLGKVLRKVCGRSSSRSSSSPSPTPPPPPSTFHSGPSSGAEPLQDPP